MVQQPTIVSTPTTAPLVGGRRVNRKRVNRKNSLTAKKERAEQAKKLAQKGNVEVDPVKFAEFQEKLAAGELDSKLMDLMKEANANAPKKNNAEENAEPLSMEEIDRQLKKDKAKFTKDANKIDKALEKVAPIIKKNNKENPVEAPKKEELIFGEFKDVGSEHQGLRYDPTHYEEEDEEEEMLRMMQQRDHIRYDMGI